MHIGPTVHYNAGHTCNYSRSQESLRSICGLFLLLFALLLPLQLPYACIMLVCYAFTFPAVFYTLCPVVVAED